MTYNNVGWTAQSKHGWVHDEGQPGNTFSPSQLPHEELQRASGIDPATYRRMHGLTVDAEETEGPKPEFRGTETGVHPKHAFAVNGSVESFQSYIPQPLPEILPMEKSTLPDETAEFE
jgi:hypothetical protein